MLGKSEILNILKKYGYYASSRGPFLYQENNQFGICFVWYHKHYGSLERVLFFDSLEAAELEVFRYWWFTNHREELVTVEFDDYETKSPKVSYYYQDRPLTVKQMKNFQDEKNNALEEVEATKRRQLLRTATILILALREKIRKHNETHEKVIELANELADLKNTYKTRLESYNKEMEEEPETIRLLKDDKEEQEAVLNKLYEDLNTLKTTEDVHSFVSELFKYFMNLEMSISFLQSQYLLKRYPYEIVDLKQKLKVLDKYEQMNAKRKLFQAKQDPFVLISDIERLSPCKKMISVETFIEKKQKNIKIKYQDHNTINENSLGDYVVNIEKLTIALPPIIEDKEYYEEFDKEDLCNTLKVKFEELGKKEKSACFVASSFLRECLAILMEKNVDAAYPISEVIGKIVADNKIHIFNDAYNALDNYNNAKIRVHYFSILNIKTFETFMSSLIEVIETLRGLKLTLNKSFYTYYVDRDRKIVNLYLKNIVHLNKDASYVAKFMPNTPIYYSPVCITRQLDIVNNHELIERNNDTLFMLREEIVIKSKDNGTVVTKYEKESTNKDECLIVHSLEEKNKCVYYEEWMYNKEDGGLYEEE